MFATLCARNRKTVGFVLAQQRNFAKLRMYNVKPISPPPGLNLKLPDWSVEEYLRRIGNDVEEHSDKFESLEEIFQLKGKEMKERDVPIRARKHIMR